MADEVHHHDPVDHLPYPSEGHETVLGLSPLGCAALMAIPTLCIVGLAVWVVFFDSDIEAFLATGNPAVLSIDGASEIAIARDEGFSEAVLEYGSVAEAYQSLVQDGQAFMVPDGTDVLIIDIRLTMMRVRVESGAFAGETGWVPDNWVRSSE